ncbi:hypothetical protein ABZ780_05380 [Micromonospora sp. NPDC047467]|uniref:hypothetical protein n=1 Tax=Micromonospora sp. NPDC047467 TaxID=3154814 RepID=UPI00340CEF0E
MLRTRTIAAAPVRSASDTWQVITDLVADTIAVSATCSRQEAEAAMQAAAPAGRMLIAGGHLDRRPLVLVAGTVHCQITTVSGTPALRADENLNIIPGAATATTFTIYLPAAEPLAQVVTDAVARHPRLSAGEPPAPQQSSATMAGAPLVDIEALRRAVTGR